MALDRRQFLGLSAGGVLGSVIAASPLAAAASRRRIAAIAFDAFPIFDPRPVFAPAETLFTGQGAALSEAWRVRQFEYQWLRAAFAGWDVAGAKWFGYPTFWMDRAGFPPEELGVAADGAGSGLSPLVDFVTARR